MEFDWVEWFGYLASLVVLVSLTMTSIIKLRVINFIGCILFAMFAYFIDSYPTMFMNLGIAGINIYFLWQIYSTKEQFKLIAASVHSEYFEHFVSSYSKEIERQTTTDKLKDADTAFYMLRNNSIAGVLVGNKDKEGTLSVLLDYVTPEYRDMKIANYYFEAHPEVMKQKGIRTLVAKSDAPEHVDYLKKVGFELTSDGEFRKSL
ncbi:hypothetical protein P7F88_08150 [Vibrio hannami]|uniref:hypothetical protein n=1 Tax=Vibrio hannami TaxID=2717094 RepID=UPI00240ED7BB|nr:hypothetical protein [Vibrio hannami]MDG3086069.1 hypothetical protein [Vibrio hannami]